MCNIIMGSSKSFKFGKKKNRKRKIRMIHNNINKNIWQSHSLETENIDRRINENDDVPNLGSEAESIHDEVDTVNVIGSDAQLVIEDNRSNDETNVLPETNNSGDEDDATGEGDVSNLERNDQLDVLQDVEDKNDADNETPMEGRRIVEMSFLMEQLREIADHDQECSFSNLIIEKKIRNGLRSKIVYRCTNCNQNFEIYNSKEPETATHTISLNSTSVLASNMIGIGYSQLEQFASVLDIPVMGADKYKSLNDEIGEGWQKTARKSMREAAEEEMKAAMERGDVDEEDGIPFITVVIDGAWSKRSYNKNFTALSGVSAIIGLHTGKILWIGVRNKYCVTCVRNWNKNLTPPQHFCTKNFSGSSGDMEWQAILEGFQSSVELHNLRYLKIVADGDSSSYTKLLEHKPYGDRYIEKYECRNHLLRNFRKLIEKAVIGCPRGLNKHVCMSLERIRKDINSVIQYRTNENHTFAQKVLSLKSDIQNILCHVFGDHSKCPSYIKNHCKNDKNYVPALIECGTYDSMSKVMRRLMYCASDLILGFNNNIAEHYNSIVAKFVGGKRVNFALSNSYKHKATAASVQYNEKSAISAFYKTMYNQNPPKFAEKIELKRLRKNQRERDRRKRNKENKIIPKRFCLKKETSSGYGERCQTHDLSAADLENEKQIFCEKLKRDQINRLSIEETTRNNRKCSLWMNVSSNVIEASDFGSICKARDLAGQVKKISQKSFAQTKAMQHHEESQSTALEQLASENNICIKSCGLLIDKELYCLAAFPTGIVDDCDMIMEIQCPSTIFDKDPNQHSVLGKLKYMEKVQDKMELKKTDDLYYKIQGHLHIWEKNVCLFCIWTSSRYKVYTQLINRDVIFFNTKIKPKLETFHREWLLPELVESRLNRNMAIRQPEM